MVLAVYQWMTLYQHWVDLYQHWETLYQHWVAHVLTIG